tara:strand:- start:317 stop:1279 length:963 start_codon:yes stop_codon:yes gene_type:complete
MHNHHRHKTINSSSSDISDLWLKAIKLPMYSVAVMPSFLVCGWLLGAGHGFRTHNLILFLVGSILILLWENLSNDLFDAQTGIDEANKPYSVVALVKNEILIRNISMVVLIMGIMIFLLITYKSNNLLIFIVLICCFIGYIYQGPPFRLGYKGLGEPLCWIAFGPFATFAAFLALIPISKEIPQDFIWNLSIILSAGPALATTLVLYCSHFHQVHEDKKHGKKSPVVRLGSKQAADLVPFIIGLIFLMELLPIIYGLWPYTGLLTIISLPSSISLIKLLKKFHNNPEKISNSKFLALKFQFLNGITLAFGLSIGSITSFY